MNNIDVRAFIIATDVVHLTNSSLLKAQFDRPAVIFNIEPISNLHPVAVDRKRLAMKNLHDHQWDELLWELERSVIVRTIGGGDFEPEGVVIRANQVIARRLTR